MDLPSLNTALNGVVVGCSGGVIALIEVMTYKIKHDISKKVSTEPGHTDLEKRILKDPVFRILPFPLDSVYSGVRYKNDGYGGDFREKLNSYMGAYKELGIQGINFVFRRPSE